MRLSEAVINTFYNDSKNVPASFLPITCHKIPCVTLFQKAFFSHRHDHHVTATLPKSVPFTVPLGAMVTTLA